MRSLCAVSILGVLLPLFASAQEHTPTTTQPATRYAAWEEHEAEHVVIAVDPCDTKEKEAIFSVDYLAHGVMPIRLIVTNNGNRPISLHDARILFITPAGEKIQAAEPKDVERLMSRKEREGGRIPMPAPLPAIKLRPKASNQAIEKDFDRFEYNALVVEPHTTREGFLFYDLSPLTNPLRGSKLHLHLLRDADGNELFYFEIPFDKYLLSKSKQMN